MMSNRPDMEAESQVSHVGPQPEHDWDTGGYCPALYGDPCRCQDNTRELYDLIRDLLADYLAEARRCQTMAGKRYGLKTIEIKELPLVKRALALLQESSTGDAFYRALKKAGYVLKDGEYR